MQLRYANGHISGSFRVRKNTHFLLPSYDLILIVINVFSDPNLLLKRRQITIKAIVVFTIGPFGVCPPLELQKISHMQGASILGANDARCVIEILGGKLQ